MTDSADAPAGRGHSVLFVDDDHRVLQGLERMLRPLRGEWTMQFVSSGHAALESLDAAPVDVIVTDMRMSGMSGVELLEQVLQSHPETVRIALSGQAERDAVLRVARLAHQYLSKPCDADLLRERLSQAIRLRGLLRDRTLQAIVTKISSLRAAPSIYAELAAEVQSPEPSLARLGAIVADDPALTAKVLQVINSAYFGLRARVSDPETAVRLLGMDTIKSLALGVEVYKRLGGAKQLDPNELWQHGMRTARLAREVASRVALPERSVQEAFTAGLLHDVGKLVLAEAVGGYSEALACGRADGLDDWSAELRAFGASHAQVAAYLLGLWGLPYGIVEAVAWHHTPGDSGIPEIAPLTAVHIANALDHGAYAMSVAKPGIDLGYLTSLGLRDTYVRWASGGLGERTA